MKKKTQQKISTGAYVLWAILHIPIGIMLVWFAQNGSLSELLTRYGVEHAISDVVLADALTLFITMNGVALVLFAVLSLWLSVRLMWRGVSLGFWMNLLLIGVLEVQFVLLQIIPGHARGPEAYIMPFLFIVGTFFGGVSFRKKYTSS